MLATGIGMGYNLLNLYLARKVQDEVRRLDFT